jgi:hypothetical protein
VRTNLLLLAVTAGLCLALAELVLGRFAPQVFRVPHVWQYDSDLGWAHRPGARGWLVEPELRVEVAIDREGLRGPEVTVAKPPGTLRVGIFGDSFAEGWGVAEPSTLRAQLEALLRKRLGSGVQVLNFGVAGYGTDQEWLSYTSRGERFGPDVVILLFFTNDLWDNLNQRGIGGRGVLVPKPRFLPTADGGLELQGVPVPRVPGWDPAPIGSAAWLARLWPALQERSQLAAGIAHLLDPRLTAPRQPRYFLGLYGPPDARAREAWKVTGRLVGAFARSARAAGARFLLVYVPANVEVEPETWRRARTQNGLPDGLDLELPSRTLGRIAGEQGVAWIDLLPVFRSRQAAGDGPLYLHEGHWNAAGQAVAARLLADGPLAGRAMPAAAAGPPGSGAGSGAQ